jgi:NADH-quinone oxidoreductase subunit A
MARPGFTGICAGLPEMLAFGQPSFPPYKGVKTVLKACTAALAALTTLALQHIFRPVSLCFALLQRASQAGTDTMTDLLGSYIPIAIFIGISLVIGLALLIAPFAVAYKAPDDEKLSAYECGFNAFDDARMKFDIRFYLVSILFIIFDLEVAFLFPWAVSFKDMGWFGFFSMMSFLGVLTIGFIYEWKKGALEWN